MPARARQWTGALAAFALLACAPSAGAAKVLPPERAFALSVRALDERTLEARFNVADGYYLYRGRIKFAVEPATAGPLAPQLPQGLPHHDEFFGDVETYRGLVVIRIPLPQPEGGARVTLATESQGCADAGICYPPQIQRLEVSIPVAGTGPSSFIEAGAGKLPWMK